MPEFGGFPKSFTFKHILQLHLQHFSWEYGLVLSTMNKGNVQNLAQTSAPVKIVKHEVQLSKVKSQVFCSRKAQMILNS